MSSTNGSTMIAAAPDSAERLVNPATNGNAVTPQANPAKIIDATLEEQDARIVISLDLHSRTERLANLKLNRTVFEGLEATNRSILLRGLRATVDDLRKAVAHKVKSKLGAAHSENASANHDEVSAGNSAAGK